MYSNLNTLSKEIHANNVKKGFWSGDRNVGELLALIHAEVSEALEAHRKDKFADMDSYDMAIIAAEVPFEETFKATIKDTFEDEIADTMIRLFDLAGGLDIDLEKHIQLKVEFNKTRPTRHGKKY